MHFTDTYLPRRDGVITSLRTLRAALAASGHASVTVAPAHSGQEPEPWLVRLPALPCGVADLRLSRWPLRPARQELLDGLKAYLPDVIHVHSPGPTGLLGVLAAQRLGVPLVQTYHTDLHAYADAYRVPAVALRVLAEAYARRLGTPMPELTGGGRRAALDAGNRLLLGPADAVVLPTAAVLQRVSLPVAARRMFLVPTGVGPRAADAEAVAAFRARYGLREDGQVLLFVGRVNREKGVELLLAAYTRILRERPATRLVLIGAVYEPRWLRRLLARAGALAAANVVITGQQPPEVVAAAYACADVFAFPSRTDTQALVLQEAAHAGVPTVMVDPELHRTGPLGGAARCVEPDPASFADGVLELLGDPRAARALGATAAANAARHTPAEFATSMLAVYAQALAADSTNSSRVAPVSSAVAPRGSVAPVP
ncbi:glycosyltransferase [Allocatelliglobosispora scoriae]|nr:glycosyltransferase [Allocatelliglobosispora scoriae]